jgi:hypothetical protein
VSFFKLAHYNQLNDTDFRLNICVNLNQFTDALQLVFTVTVVPLMVVDAVPFIAFTIFLESLLVRSHLSIIVVEDG